MSSCLVKVGHEVFNGTDAAEILRNRITSIFLLYLKLLPPGTWVSHWALPSSALTSSHHHVWPCGGYCLLSYYHSTTETRLRECFQITEGKFHRRMCKSCQTQWDSPSVFSLPPVSKDPEVAEPPTPTRSILDTNTSLKCEPNWHLP